MPIKTAPVERDDIADIATLFCSSFMNPADGPYGTAGVWVATLWPNMDSPEGVESTRKRLLASYDESVKGHNILLLKAIDSEAAEPTRAIGFCSVNIADAVSKDIVYTPYLSRDIFSSDEHYERYLSLAKGRNDMVWDSVKELRSDRPAFFIKTLAVDVPHQKRGIGSMLLSDVMGRARLRHGSLAILNGGFLPAVKMYEKAGFQVKQDDNIPVEGTRWSDWPQARLVVMTMDADANVAIGKDFRANTKNI